MLTHPTSSFLVHKLRLQRICMLGLASRVTRRRPLCKVCSEVNENIWNVFRCRSVLRSQTQAVFPCYNVMRVQRGTTCSVPKPTDFGLNKLNLCGVQPRACSTRKLGPFNDTIFVKTTASFPAWRLNHAISGGGYRLAFFFLRNAARHGIPAQDGGRFDYSSCDWGAGWTWTDRLSFTNMPDYSTINK